MLRLTGCTPIKAVSRPEPEASGFRIFFRRVFPAGRNNRRTGSRSGRQFRLLCVRRKGSGRPRNTFRNFGRLSRFVRLRCRSYRKKSAVSCSISLDLCGGLCLAFCAAVFGSAVRFGAGVCLGSAVCFGSGVCFGNRVCFGSGSFFGAGISLWTGISFGAAVPFWNNGFILIGDIKT